MFDRRKGDLVEDLCRLDSLELEEIFGTKELRDTVSSLLTHVFASLLHKLVSPTFLASLRLIRSLCEYFFYNIF